MKQKLNFHIKQRNDFGDLYNLIYENIKADLVINLQMPFLEPIDILILTQISIYSEKIGNGIIINVEKNGIYEYMESIGLIEFINSNIIKPTTIDSIPSYTAMPIKRVERETMGEYITDTENYFKKMCEGKDLTMLNLCLSELINNVYDHSNSIIGAYVFSQFYSKTNEIKIAVSDLGVGIPFSVQKFHFSNYKIELTDIQSVKWAIKENRTTRSIPQNMGKGLDNLNTFVRKNNCSWKLYSGSVLLNGVAGKNRYSNHKIKAFKGTVVQVNIKIDNLPIKEQLLEFDLDF